MSSNDEGLEKSALLLLTLGADEAAEVLKLLGPKEVPKLGAAMAGMAAQGREKVEVVLDELIAAADKATPIEADHDRIKEMLTKALGDERASHLIGRVLQGAGAISAAVTALAADLTRDQHRTKVMAMIGSSIGLVFALSMVAAPLLYALIGMSGLFWLTAVLAVAAIFTIVFIVPAAPPVPRAVGRFSEVLGDGQLMRLNFGVFALHLMQTAMWVLVPAGLVRAGLPVVEHWKVYLPAVLLSFVVMVPAIIVAEKRGKMKPIFNAAIGLLLVVQIGLYVEGSAGMWPLAILLTLFFVAFNVLEATQPSWISKIAPAHAKGTALGVYNTLQSLGFFVGGLMGGWLVKSWGSPALFLCCGVAMLAWLLVAWPMQTPGRSAPLGQAA